MKAALLSELEEKIHYTFRNRHLLEMAMTHSSYANEHRREKLADNERLEFLGDAVLEAVCSEYLYHLYPGMGEGKLSTTRASMVCEPSLAKCARDLGLPSYLRLGKGEEQMGGRTKDSIISDATEALIGAVFLDGGFEEARSLVRTFILLDLKQEDLFRDRKTLLQEVVTIKGVQVEYRLIGEEGPPHDRIFTVAAVVDSEIRGIGKGRTKKAAEQEAARNTLNLLQP